MPFPLLLHLTFLKTPNATRKRKANTERTCLQAPSFCGWIMCSIPPQTDKHFSQLYASRFSPWNQNFRCRSNGTKFTLILVFICTLHVLHQEKFSLSDLQTSPYCWFCVSCLLFVVVFIVNCDKITSAKYRGCIRIASFTLLPPETCLLQLCNHRNLRKLSFQQLPL